MTAWPHHPFQEQAWRVTPALVLLPSRCHACPGSAKFGTLLYSWGTRGPEQETVPLSTARWVWIRGNIRLVLAGALPKQFFHLAQTCPVWGEEGAGEAAVGRSADGGCAEQCQGPRGPSAAQGPRARAQGPRARAPGSGTRRRLGRGVGVGLGSLGSAGSATDLAVGLSLP